MSWYVKIDGVLYSPGIIQRIDCTEIEDFVVYVHLITLDVLKIEGLEAIEVAMQTKPSIIEGKRFAFKKGAWIVHNLIGHPLMQFFALIRLFRLAIWIHEITIPRPKGKYERRN